VDPRNADPVGSDRHRADRADDGVALLGEGIERSTDRPSSLKIAPVDVRILAEFSNRRTVETLPIRMAGRPVDTLRPISGACRAEFIHSKTDFRNRESASRIMKKWIPRIRDYFRIEIRRVGII